MQARTVTTPDLLATDADPVAAIQERILNLDAVVEVQSLQYFSGIGYVEVIVQPQGLSESMAENLRQIMLEHVDLIEFSAILDDGVGVPVSYLWRSSGWSITRLETIATHRALTTQQSNMLPSVPPQVRVPGNCSTAVAQGLSAQQAAQYPGLDRDRDGVACYGD